MYSLCSLRLRDVCIYISLSLCACCKQGPISIEKTEIGAELVTCDLNKVTETKQLLLSDIVESCEIVVLSSEEEAILENIWQVDISEEYIGIRSSGQPKLPYKLFDRDGNYLNDIGKIGNGPFEYLTLISSAIDQEKGIVYLVPFGTTKNIFHYDLDGKPVKTIPTTFPLRKPKLIVRKEGNVFFSMPFMGDSSIVLVQNSEGAVLKNIKPKDSWYSSDYSEEVFSYSNDEKMLFFNTAVDTLLNYDFQSNSLTPLFTIKYKNQTLKIPHFCFELPLFYVTWIKGKDYIFVTKKDLQAFSGNVVNDFYGNLPVKLSNCTNGYYIDYYSSFDLRQRITAVLENNDISYEALLELYALYNSLDDMGNFVLFIGKLKNK